MCGTWLKGTCTQTQLIKSKDSKLRIPHPGVKSYQKHKELHDPMYMPCTHALGGPVIANGMLPSKQENTTENCTDVTGVN